MMNVKKNGRLKDSSLKIKLNIGRNENLLLWVERTQKTVSVVIFFCGVYLLLWPK